MRVLALDIGSSSVRARVFDERGEHVEGAEAQTKYAFVDPDTLVEATRSTLEEARKAGECDAVAASCFMHSLVAVDRRGRAISPLLTWRDQRAAEQARRLATQVDPAEVHARTGCVLHPSYWPAKLAWLREESPETFAAAERFLSFSDYLYGALVGDTKTSLSMASGTGLLDLDALAWDERLLDLLELSPARLPEITCEPVGTEERPWFPALGDGACSNLGAGCTTRERAALMVGTSGAYRILYAADHAEPRPGLFCYRLDDRRLVEGGALSDGGNLFAWLERTLAETDAKGIAQREPSGHGLTFLTLLGGERSPGWRPNASGTIAGLTFETTPQDLLQAALEGVAYRFAEIAELLQGVQEVVATGHALLADPDWIQILADVLERPLTASAVPEGSARGAAVVALERLGASPEPAALGKAYAPRPDRADAHRAARERQRELYRTLA